MSAATLIHEAEKDGLRFALTPSRTVKLTGPKDAAEKWAPRLREHKAEIVASLAALSTIAANEDGIDEATIFWSNLIDRINWCDILVHTLCDVCGDDQARRDDLILTRQRLAPDMIDGDIRYLLAEIEIVTPTSPPEPKRDCRDCDHHRGRNNNAARYCVSPGGAAQRDDALASPILDSTIASRCRAFKKYTL